MTFEDARANINALIERAQNGDQTLSNAQIVAAVNKFESALSFRVHASNAALVLLDVAAKLCRARPTLRDELMPTVMWAWSEGTGEGTARDFAAWLARIAQNSPESAREERHWLSQTARDETGIEKWLETMRVWIIQSETDA